MATLSWIDNPRTVTKSYFGNPPTVLYIVSFPSMGASNDPALAFFEPSLFMAEAYKRNSDGLTSSYIVGHGYNRDSDAQAACQRDFDAFPNSVPPGVPYIFPVFDVL